MIPVQRLNHAVLYVRDAAASATFYQEVLGFEVVEQLSGAVFLRCGGTTNHHDLGLFSVVVQPTLTRSACSASAPNAMSTGEGSSDSDEHAEPE